MGRPVAHLAGRCNVARGRFRRQRCEWCGVALIEDDLARLAFAPGTPPPATAEEWARQAWEPGTWVEVTEGNPRVTAAMSDQGDRMPDNSCMALECDLVVSEEASRG